MDFSGEPAHSDKLNIKGQNPWNAEPSLADLVKHTLTPEDLIYSRNHGPIKSIDPVTFKIKIDGPGGLVENILEFTLADLRREFRKAEVIAALQCTGNRRKLMVEKKQYDTEGIMWNEATICNVKWGGVRMRDILMRAEIKSDADKREGLHLCFASHVTPCEEADWFGGSIPLEKAMDPEGDVLLAYEFNGKQLSHDHGYPFRIVVPGYSGVRWVKWVQRITVSTQESDNYYQKKDYKVLPSNVTTHDKAIEEDWWSRLPPLQSNTLNSVVASAVLDSSDNQLLHVEGYAIPGSTGQVKKVEVSVDKGQTWTGAKTTYQAGKWSWTLWEADVKVSSADIGVVGISGVGSMKGCVKGGGRKVLSRAVDDGGNKQKMDEDVQWNLRGIGYDAVGEKAF